LKTSIFKILRERVEERDIECAYYHQKNVVKNGKEHHQDGKAMQNYLCKGCGTEI